MHQKRNWQNAPLCAGLMGQTTKQPLQFRVQIKKTASLLDILSRPQVVFMFQDHKSSADICTPTYTATQIASRIISNHSKHHSKIQWSTESRNIWPKQIIFTIWLSALAAVILF